MELLRFVAGAEGAEDMLIWSNKNGTTGLKTRLLLPALSGITIKQFEIIMQFEDVQLQSALETRKPVQILASLR
jgi:hypothetical protein